MTKKLSGNEIVSFVKNKEISIIHINADWDRYRIQITEKIKNIEKKYDELVSFAYYRQGKLVAVVIGVQQDITKNIELIGKGQDIDTENLKDILQA